MKILIIGSGGREHAIAWKVAQSERAVDIIVRPGNGGTHFDNLSRNHITPPSLLELANRLKVDLTIVGPEIPLAAGIVDEFQAHGLRIWGPTKGAAQIEASKSFAKAFMVRHNIPTGSYASFTDFELARQYLLAQKSDVVIKADGLAAGKGVIVPDAESSVAEAEEALHRIMIDRQFGDAGREVIIEERLTGPELSVFAFCDGQTAIIAPPAQDHKRAFNNDLGLNTGGMGAYAPAPLGTPDLLAQIEETVIKPTLSGLRNEGTPFVGVLYAGLMLTPDGPKVLEFNCRFGDPETQVILPLLKTDLLDIIEYSLDGRLSELTVEWETGSAAAVVLASGGYPAKYEQGKPITGLERAATLDNLLLFHAGTGLTDDGQVVTAGGRVLAVTGVGETLAQALGYAYAGVELIEFEGMQYRTDIGVQAL